MRSGQQALTVSPDIEIWTEGKTDWQLLRKAREKLGLDLSIAFQESKESMGDHKLLQSCKTFAKRPNTVPMLFIFDRDNAIILKEVTDPIQEFKDWGNNVYSFAIPVPSHRIGCENVCIEFYFSDHALKTQDSHGRRLFITSEFNEKSGKNRLDASINVGSKGVLRDCTETHKAKIIDSEVYDKHNSNIALAKASFAYNIVNDVKPFDTFDFEEFRKIFRLIEQIVQVSQPQTSVCLPDRKALFAGIEGLEVSQQFDVVFSTLMNILEMVLQLFIITTIRCYEDAINNEPEQYKKKLKPIKDVLKREFRQPSLKTIHHLARSCYYLIDSSAPERLIQMKGCLEGVMVLGDIGQVINDLERIYPPVSGKTILVNKPEIRRGIIDFIVPELIQYYSKAKGSLQQKIDEATDKIDLNLMTWENAVMMLLSKVEPVLSNTFVLKTLESVDTQAGTYTVSVKTYEGSRLKRSVISVPAEDIEQYQSNVPEMLISDDAPIQLSPFLVIKDNSLFFYKRTLASGYEYYSIKENKVHIQETKKKFNHSVFRIGSKQELFWTDVPPIINAENRVKANIPLEGQANFVGRKRQIRSIMEEIIEIPNQNGIIYGLGGIGKTALMLNVSKKLFDDQPAESVAFENIIWVSAKSDYYDYIFDTVEYRDPQYRSLDNVLFAILEFFGLESLEEYDFEDRKDLTLELLEQNRVLLVLDNFETVPLAEGEKLIKFFEIEVKRALRKKPENFRVIITSRKQIASGFHQIELKGLDLRESKLLMASLYKRYSSKPELSSEQTDKLHELTKGIPIVLKHCLAQIWEYNKTFEAVISNLFSYSSNIVQFSFNEILQQIEKSDKEGIQLQILLLLELTNRPLMVRQIADILEIETSVIENKIPTLIDYQCLRRINQDNQEKFVINEEIRLLTRSLAMEHSELVKSIRNRITSNFSIDKQMDYTPNERRVVEVFENYVTEKEYLEAERFITGQLNERPDSILINYHYARYLKNQKRDVSEAIEILERIRESAGNHVSILRLLFSCYISLDVPNFNKASAYVGQLEKDLGGVEDVKLEIAEFYVRWSTSIRLKTKYDPLEEASRQKKYKSLASKAINILHTTHTRTSQIYYLFAQGYFNMWENKLALGMIDKAIASTSGSSEDYPQSFKDFKKTIQRNMALHSKRRR